MRRDLEEKFSIMSSRLNVLPADSLRVKTYLVTCGGSAQTAARHDKSLQLPMSQFQDATFALFW